MENFVSCEEERAFEAYIPHPDRSRPDTLQGRCLGAKQRRAAGVSLDLKVGSQREAGAA